MKKLLILLLFLYPTIGMAQIQAQKGDIVVFNTPLQIEKIKVQLFQCNFKGISCTNWKPLITESPVLNPAAYYIFHLSDQDKSQLEGNEINIKVYSMLTKQWSDRLPFITKYHADENPFYQFSCWSRKEAAPHFGCSNTDSLAIKKSYIQKLYALLSTFDRFLFFRK